MRSLFFFLLSLQLLAQPGVSIGGATALPVINLGVQPGVDCTGMNDSSLGINRVFAFLTGHKVVIPHNCTLQVTSQLAIFGQSDFEIEGEGFMPNNSIGPIIFGCSGAAGPVIFINRSGYFSLRNFGVYAKGASCSSRFTASVVWSNLGGGGVTSTYAKVEGMSLETNPNGAKIRNYFAFGLGMNRSGVVTGATNPNEEQLTFRDNFVHCQSSPGSYGLWLYGVNADNGSAVNNRLDACFQPIRIDAGNLKLIEKNHFDSGGSFSVFGANGADIFLAGCSSGGMNIIANEASDGGPFINTNNDVATGGCPITMIGNVMGISDIGPSAYPVNLGAFSSAGLYTLISNQFVMTARTTATAIGSSSQSNCGYGPLGDLVEINNTIDLTKVGGWTGCVGKAGIIPFQSGEYHQNSPLGLKALVIEGNSFLTRAGAMVTAYPDAGPNDPGCNRIGRIWYDTATPTTVMKVCLKVRNTLTWVAK